MTVVERYRRAQAFLGTEVASDEGPPAPGVEDVSSLVRSVSWVDAVDPPWQSCTIRMSGRSVTQPPFDIGDHIIVRNAIDLPADGWFIVVNVSSSIRKGDSGAPEQGEWAIQALGWLDWLGRVDLITYLTIANDTAAGVLPTAIGTIFGSGAGPFSQGDDTSQAFDVSNQGHRFGVGVSLAKFISFALRIELPAAIAPKGTYLRDAVGVCYDAQTAGDLTGPGSLDHRGAPARQAEPIVGFQASPQPLLNGSTKILGYIQGTWGIDPAVGEMFPSLDDPPVSGIEGGEDTALLSGPAQVLQRNPVMLYRMRPWRAEPLRDWIGRVKTLVSIRDYTLKILQSPEFASFGGVSWDISRAINIEASDVIGMDYAYSDDDACTVMTADIPGALSAESFQTQVGLPIVDTSAAQLGARLYTVSWPFTRSADSVGGEILSSMTNQVCVLAAQGAQWHIAADRFARGSLQLRYSPNVRHGEPFIVTLPNAVFVAYCDSRRHTVEVQDKAIKRSTVVNFSRGTWNEADRVYPRRANYKSTLDYDRRIA